MENSGENSGAQSQSPAPMVRQAHGGALRRGGATGGGRPPHKIKAKCRKEFEALLPDLKKIAKGKLPPAGSKLDPDGDFEEVSVRDRLKAIELFGKFGMDQNVSIADIRAALLATRQELAEVLTKDQLDMVWNRIMSHWVKL